MPTTHFDLIMIVAVSAFQPINGSEQQRPERIRDVPRRHFLFFDRTDTPSLPIHFSFSRRRGKPFPLRTPGI